MIKERKSTPADLIYLAENMRQADIDEAWALDHSTPAEAIASAVLLTDFPKTAVGGDGKLLAMWGVASETRSSLVGVPWMLSSNDLSQKHIVEFARRSAANAIMLKNQYAALYNFVDARHTLAVRWLGWMGFKIYRPIPFGADDLLFHVFFWGDTECVVQH